ncbi:MAG: preprotein translocase subunit SecE [Pseudomonadota bacterium]
MKNVKNYSQQKTPVKKSKLEKPRVEKTKPEKAKKSKSDSFLWLIITVLVLGGIVANVYYDNIALPIRIIAWLILAIVVLFIAYYTNFGKKSWQFLLDAKMELRKVVWPTRQEAVQTSMLVIAMVIVMALILWGVDSVLLWAVGTLTGQSG